MLRLPLRHWWSVGLLVLAAIGLLVFGIGLVRLYWVIGVVLVWTAIGYLADRSVLHRWAGCFHERITQNASQASAWFRKSLTLSSTQAEVQARVGHLALREQDYAEAVHHLEASVQAMPSAVQPRLDLALAHSKLGQHQLAVELAASSLQLAPQSEAACLVLGQVRKAAGDLGGAQAACEDALQGRGSSAPAHRLLGEVLYRQGSLVEAQRHLQRAMTLDPEHPDSHYWLGSLYLDGEEWMRSERQLVEALNRLVQPTYASDVNRSAILQKLAEARTRVRGR